MMYASIHRAQSQREKEPRQRQEPQNEQSQKSKARRAKPEEQKKPQQRQEQHNHSHGIARSWGKARIWGTDHVDAHVHVNTHTEPFHSSSSFLRRLPSCHCISSLHGLSPCMGSSAGPQVAFAENLRGHGSGLSTCQAEGGPHAPENPASPPTVGFRVSIDGLVQSPEVKLSLVVGKEIQQAKKFPMKMEREKGGRKKGDKLQPKWVPFLLPDQTKKMTDHHPGVDGRCCIGGRGRVCWLWRDGQPQHQVLDWQQADGHSGA